MDRNSDPKFQQFLETIKNQNKADLALQGLQVKYEREVAGEDDDKREKQLEKISDQTEESSNTLKNIEKSITGTREDNKILPKSIAGELTARLTNLQDENEKTLTESLKETIGGIKSAIGTIGKGISGAFNIGKGLLTNPKEVLAAGGTRLVNKTKEKLTQAGAYIADVSKTEAGYTAEKDRFAKEFARQEQSKGSQLSQDELMSQGKEKYSQIVKNEQELKNVEQSIKKSKTQGFEPLQEDIDKRENLIQSIKTIRGGVPSEASVEERKGVTGINPEADNIQTSQEIMADAAKQDVELTKENNKVLQDQLSELKKISAALVPRVPADLPEGRLKPTPASEESGGGLGLGDAIAGIGSMAKSAGRAILGGAKAVGRGVVAAGKGALALGKGVAKFAGSTGGKLLGAAAAVGMGAYTAYQGYTAAEDSKQAKLQDIQTRLDKGEITPEQAASERKEAGNTATIEKSGAVGEGTGMAAGAIAGGAAGAKLGATIGTFVGGPVGTAIGAGVGTIAGGALGAFAGTKAGKYVGEKVGEGINYVGEKAKAAYTGAKETASNIGSKVAGFFGFGDKNQKPEISAKGPVSQTTEQFTKIAGEKVVPGQPLSEKQMAVIEMSKASGNKYSPEVEAQYAKQKSSQGITASVVPSQAPVTGPKLAQASNENTDLTRSLGTPAATAQPIVASSVNTVNTTSYVPIKPSPRPDRTGSALDRYNDRVASY